MQKVHFDADQQKVVSHVQGPLLVVAGAGSGKTATIIGRAVALIEKGIPAHSHLMLTFSRKAADEMRARIGESVDKKALSGMVLSTFHSFGYQLLREQPQLCGRRKGVTVMDERDVQRLLKELCQEIDFQLDIQADAGKALLRRLYGVYSLGANDLLDPGESRHGNALEMLLDKSGITHRQHRAMFFTLFAAYAEQKRKLNLVDFDDLLCLPVRALMTQKAAGWRQALVERFPFITVDEGQDTNPAQYALLEIIGAHGNIVLVGDDDQAIYSWRGASPRNMPDFVRSMKAKVVMLPRNYRSSASIIEQASVHVSRNKKRFDKQAYAVRHGGNPIEFVSADTSWDGAYGVAERIAKSLAKGVQAKEIAVLYRVNRLARALEYALSERGIRYRIVGGTSLESKKEVRMCIALARLVINRSDLAALETVTEVLPGMGKSALSKVRGSLSDGDESIFSPDVRLPAKARASMNKLDATVTFLEGVGGVQALVGQALSSDGLNILGTISAKDSQELRRERRNNLELLQRLIEGWAKQAAAQGEVFGFEQLLERILGSEANSQERDDRVILSSIHKAKGLEWSEVHVFGYSDGLMPLASKGNADEDEDGLSEEEERRLSYVAITRAKRHCTLWHCYEYDFGYETARYPLSRFVGEMNLRCATL